MLTVKCAKGKDFVNSQKVLEDIGAMRVSFLKVAIPMKIGTCPISLNGGLALKFI
jgi:hypothetical protein